ncbi:DUF3303 family protein [Streptomyces sp. A012304]|uniref:DUF3303 family protein n=1 Tax=Streptomyces sp. A012304 TaxID=375446 RepID=UPI0022329D36|nr:DUF3303 family protein [Streptomyces sp. A012304]
MRVMIKANLSTDRTNELFRTGKVPEVMQAILERIKPEAAYFGPEHGKRTCFLICDLEDNWRLPATLEPLFDQFDAEVEVFPVMDREDLRKGLAQLG